VELLELIREKHKKELDPSIATYFEEDLNKIMQDDIENFIEEKKNKRSQNML
jgi:hypothetical protein